METNEPVQEKIIKISRRKLILAIIIIAIIGIIWVLAGSMRTARYGSLTDSMSSNELPAVTSGSGSPGIPSISPNEGSYYDRGGQPDITDTREFLKTNYSANVKTRDVRDAVKTAKGAVREVNGRIDSENSSQKSGYISFVVPKSRFEEFRSEIESITHAKLFTENISTQNLLSQKQNIELQMQNATSTLANLEKQKRDLDTSHSAKVAAINRELATLKAQLTTVRERQQTTQDQNQLAALSAEESTLAQREAVLKQNLSNENRSYASQSQNLASQISHANQYVKNVENQDEQFGNNIETVNGHISFKWVSVWDMSVAISPIHPTIIIVAIILIAWYILRRTGYLPKVELV